MKAHFLLISIILSIITCSCKNKANSASTVTVDETITLSPQKIDLTDVEYSETPQLLSDFVDSIEYIRLSDQPLIPDTRKVRLSEDVQGNLYLDFNEIYKYTPRGKYLKSLVTIYHFALIISLLIFDIVKIRLFYLLLYK